MSEGFFEVGIRKRPHLSCWPFWLGPDPAGSWSGGREGRRRRGRGTYHDLQSPGFPYKAPEPRNPKSAVLSPKIHMSKNGFQGSRTEALLCESRFIPLKNCESQVWGDSRESLKHYENRVCLRIDSRESPRSCCESPGHLTLASCETYHCYPKGYRPKK